jgi:Protein of unknown function (DUF3102)
MSAQTTIDIAASNSLADLAARIRVEHEAVSDALADSVRHAIAAGELLIEAKGQLKHGQWLPWLRDHCTISERTAQLYMRVAKNRTEIENQIRNGVADLSLNEAAALLMLSSDVRKLFNFARDCQHLSGEALIERCIAEGVGVIHDSGYDPFHGRSEEEQVEWALFILFLSFGCEGRMSGFEPDHARDHVEYLLQRPFQNVTEWLGPEGDRWRGNPFNGYRERKISDEFKANWATFLAKNRHRTLDDIFKAIDGLQAQFRLSDLGVSKPTLRDPRPRRAARR